VQACHKISSFDLDIENEKILGSYVVSQKISAGVVVVVVIVVVIVAAAATVVVTVGRGVAVVLARTPKVKVVLRGGSNDRSGSCSLNVRQLIRAASAGTKRRKTRKKEEEEDRG